MAMKLFKRIAPVIACLALIACTGCNKPTYRFYTNIPQGGFEIHNKSFEPGGTIGGFTPSAPEYVEEDVSGYASVGYRITVMQTEVNFVVSNNFDSAGAKQKYEDFCKAVVAELKSLDSAISTAVTYSDINNFNNAAPGEEIEILQTSYEILSLAKDMYEKTEGYYNPALYYNIHAYGFGAAQTYPTNASELPKDEDIAKYTDLAKHFSEIAPYERGGKYFVTKPAYTVEVGGETLSLKIDLGGIGKGYAVDKVDKLFDDYGYKYGYLDFGSSSMLFKSNVQDGNYTIAFKNPRTPDPMDYYFTAPVRNEKISTSGDNNQRYFIDGVRYCHIIDPTTGKPVQTGIMSVSIIGGSAAEDDAYTTAIMAMGKDRAISFIEENLTDRRVVFTVE